MAQLEEKFPDCDPVIQSPDHTQTLVFGWSVTCSDESQELLSLMRWR